MCQVLGCASSALATGTDPRSLVTCAGELRQVQGEVKPCRKARRACLWQTVSVHGFIRTLDSEKVGAVLHCRLANVRNLRIQRGASGLLSAARHKRSSRLIRTLTS